MFRLTNLRRTASILTITTLAATSPVVAQTLSDNVSIERAYNEETGNYEMRRITTGENGTITTSRVCGEGEVENGRQGCFQVKSVAGVNGKSAAKGEVVVQGPVRTRAVGKTATPDGEERQFQRRWRN